MSAPVPPCSPTLPTLLQADARQFCRKTRNVMEDTEKTYTSVPPGPCDYVGDDRSLAHHSKAPRATFGSGPGHRDAFRCSSSPGPADYKTDALRTHRPSAVFGSSPGHDAIMAQMSPGPTDYEGVTKATCRGGNYFTSARRGLSGASPWLLQGAAEERRQFRHHDLDRNGVLDFREVCLLLQRGDSSIKDIEVQKLFQSMDANVDGRIQFEELRRFLHSDSIQSSAWRKRLGVALHSSSPGPCDYVADAKVQSQHKQAPKATIGNGPGHECGSNKGNCALPSIHTGQSNSTARGSGLAAARMRRRSCPTGGERNGKGNYSQDLHHAPEESPAMSVQNQ